MEIINYTGEPVGLTDASGRPIRVLPSIGKAVVVFDDYELQKTEDFIPIYRKKRGVIKYLPQPDGNLQKMYIVNRDVADAGRLARMDLLIVEEPDETAMRQLGGKFYRKVVNI